MKYELTERGRGGEVERKRKDSKRFLPFVSSLSCLILVLCLSHSLAQPARKKNAPPPEPPVTAEEATKLEAVIKTEMGDMRMEFFPEMAPQHVIAFIKRARAGYYDGSAFFRVIARGLIQGGDPLLKENAPRALGHGRTQFTEGRI
jgi:hypothetical protein